MSITDTKPGDPGYWAAQMRAVSLARDQASFMRIYDYFAPRVRLYLRGLGAPAAVAEELSQEALFRLWQRADSYDSARSTVATWLFRIARNLHIDRLRRESNWMPVDVELEEEETDSPDFSSAESFTAHADLNERIERLPAIQARLIRMSYFEAKSHQQIADELGMPLGTVKSSIRRAFQRLQSSVQGAA